MRCEDVQRFGRAGYGDLGFEQIARVGAVVTEVREARVLQPRLRARDRETADDATAKRIVDARADGKLIRGKERDHPVRHLVLIAVRDFVERDDVGIQIAQLSRDGLHLRRVGAPVGREFSFHVVVNQRQRSAGIGLNHSERRRRAVGRACSIGDGEAVKPGGVGREAG